MYTDSSDFESKYREGKSFVFSNIVAERLASTTINRSVNLLFETSHAVFLRFKLFKINVITV